MAWTFVVVELVDGAAAAIAPSGVVTDSTDYPGAKEFDADDKAVINKHRRAKDVVLMARRADTSARKAAARAAEIDHNTQAVLSVLAR